MTQILNLPLLSFPVSTGTNENWTDAWAAAWVDLGATREAIR